jgi:hypothetical protein
MVSAVLGGLWAPSPVPPTIALMLNKISRANLTRGLLHPSREHFTALTGTIYHQNRQSGTSRPRHIEPGEAAPIFGEQGALDTHYATSMTIDTSTAHQLEPSRTTRDYLKVVVVPRRIKRGLGAVERAAEPGNKALVGRRAEILTGDTVLTGRRIEGAYQGKG